MNYLIIGLGNFGVALATRLTTMGHDVTGVDADMRIVEEYKSQITTTMCVNIIDQVSIKALPLDDIDAVIVSLGNHIGESIVIVSLLKQAGVKNIIARAVSPMHRTILEAIGVNEVIEPEQLTADIWAYSAESEKIKGVYTITNDHQILECQIPSILEGQSLSNANIEETFGITLVAIKRRRQQANFLGSRTLEYEAVNIQETPEFRFAADDHIIVYGSNKILEKFKKQL
ncbi:MAG: TrkA family potassium uptake protein [Paludibacteraceae bacterium]|nr:TrkA family potassium uptake protein [Paludibacteraceae bacterium]